MGMPEFYDDASHGAQVLFWVFAITRIVLFLGYGIVNAVQFLFEVTASKETKSSTRLYVYSMCTLMSITRGVAFILKLTSVDVYLDGDSSTAVTYKVLIIIGTYAILIQWFAIGKFWISTFYMFYSSHERVLDRSVQTRVNRIIWVVDISITVWILITCILSIIYPTSSLVGLVYNIIYLLVVFVVGGQFVYHGHVLSRSFKRDIKSHENRSRAVVVAHRKTSFLVKVLAIICILAILRSAIFSFAFPNWWSYVVVSDVIAMILELTQMTGVMLTVSMGSMIPFLTFRRAYSSSASAGSQHTSGTITKMENLSNGESQYNSKVFDYNTATTAAGSGLADSFVVSQDMGQTANNEISVAIMDNATPNENNNDDNNSNSSNNPEIHSEQTPNPTQSQDRLVESGSV